jgi:hypothetical protein
MFHSKREISRLQLGEKFVSIERYIRTFVLKSLVFRQINYRVTMGRACG